MMRTVNRPNVPAPPNLIRMEIWRAGRAVQIGNDVHFTDFSYLDFGGYIPKSLLRLSMGS